VYGHSLGRLASLNLSAEILAGARSSYLERDRDAAPASQRCFLFCLVVEAEPLHRILPSRLLEAVFGGEGLELQPVAPDLKPVERQQFGEVDFPDLVAAFDQGAGEKIYRPGIAVLPGTHERSILVVGERHHLLGGPKCVIW